jgi:hypothetical protein
LDRSLLFLPGLHGKGWGWDSVSTTTGLITAGTLSFFVTTLESVAGSGGGGATLFKAKDLSVQIIQIQINPTQKADAVRVRNIKNAKQVFAPSSRTSGAKISAKIRERILHRPRSALHMAPAHKGIEFVGSYSRPFNLRKSGP